MRFRSLPLWQACAEGTTIIRDAQELRVKETDRIETITDNLIAMGCSVLPTEDGMVIKGEEPLKGATIHTLLDHRIAWHSVSQLL